MKVNSTQQFRKIKIRYIFIFIPILLSFVILSFFLTSFFHLSNTNADESLFYSISTSLSSTTYQNNVNSISAYDTSASSTNEVLGLDIDCALINLNVDKEIGLDPKFVPSNLVELVEVKTNKAILIKKELISDLIALFADAKKQGLELQVISGYRSYETQLELFSSYVQQEQSKGLSYKEAINVANIYSAKAGHSEHQLGTVVDLANTYSTNPFDLVDAENKELFRYLEKNANKFGFYISYPENNNKGYQYEPWHLRWFDSACI
ncbi:M15 family metallopeptidase [bacterium]|nr:MAG: M15 family metallopeptidase [bacterium]